MNVFVLRHVRTGAAIGAVAKAEGYWERLVGLLPSAKVAIHDGMWLEPAAAVHTIGMRASIDIIFLDRDGRVLRTHENGPPNRLAIVCPGARVTVELGAGTLARTPVERGDEVRLEEAAVPA